MALNKTDLSFKKLINKEFTAPGRLFFQENTVPVFDLNSSEIYTDFISSSADYTTGSGVAIKYDKFILTPDLTFPASASYFISGAGFTPGTDTLPSFANSSSYYQRNFISDKYGTEYTVELYDNTDQQIFPTDAINWIFDYKTGILHIANPGSYPTPYKVTVYQYIGETLDTTLTNLGSGEGFPYTGGAVITGSLLVSGSSPTVTVTGSVEVTNGITGSLYGTASFATGLVPELFEIPELLGGVTGSGLVISSSGLPLNTFNSVRIGSTELVNLGTSFLINLDSANAFTFSGSSGAISYMAQDAFNLYQSDGANRVFAFNSTTFNIFPNASTTSSFKVTRNSGDTYISGTLQVANLPQEDSLARVITSNANGNLAYTSSAYFAPSTAVNTLSLLYNSLNDEVDANTSAISNLQTQTSSYITEAETGSMLEPYLLSSQTGSTNGGGFNELVINNGVGGGNLTVTGDTTINGNLYVYGVATELQVEHLRVEDRFILLNSSSVTPSLAEGGIIVQTSTSSGTAIFYEQSTNRWMVAQSSSVGIGETNITVAGTTDYIVTVSASAGSPVGAPPNFGNGNDNFSVGQMYVDLTAHDIYIYA